MSFPKFVLQTTTLACVEKILLFKTKLEQFIGSFSCMYLHQSWDFSQTTVAYGRWIMYSTMSVLFGLVVDRWLQIFFL